MSQVKTKNSGPQVGALMLFEGSAKSSSNTRRAATPLNGALPFRVRAAPSDEVPEKRYVDACKKNRRKTLMKDIIRPEAVEILVLMAGLAAVLVMSCYVGWC